MSKLYYHVLIEYDKSLFHIFSSDNKELAEMYFEDAEYIAGYIPDHTELPTAIVRRYKLINIYKINSDCFLLGHTSQTCFEPMENPVMIHILGTKNAEFKMEDVIHKAIPYIEWLRFTNYDLLSDEMISEFYCN